MFMMSALHVGTNSVVSSCQPEQNDLVCVVHEGCLTD